MGLNLLIVGSSVRSAAQSAQRAGFQPCAIDQFADVDLRSTCPAVQVVDYPQGILSLARQFAPGPFLYTGALENYPELLEALSSERPLLGNGPKIVRAVRDPWTLQQALSAGGFRFPRIVPEHHALPPNAWLRKPFRSGGGIGIRRVPGGMAASTTAPNEAAHYYQELVDGTPVSALFVAAAGSAILLEITRQLVGCSWAGATGFLYVGNIAPMTVLPHTHNQFQQLGALLAERFRLCGLFGVDAILRGAEEEEVWTLEVNPRYTAAMELLDHSHGFSAIGLHREACENARQLPLEPAAQIVFRGKAIVYARRALVVSDRFANWSAAVNSNAQNGNHSISDVAHPRIADLPAPGTSVAKGQPLCTVLCCGATEADVESALQVTARRVDSIIAASHE